MQEAIRVAWLYDTQVVESIVNSSTIAPFVLEGEAFSAAPPSNNMLYLGVYKATDLVGVFLFVRRLKHMWEVHTCLTTACRGKLAIDAGKLALVKLFTDVDIECLSTFVPDLYLHVQAYTKRMGFTLLGIMPRSFNHLGQQQDCYFYATTREEVLSCLQQL